MTPSRHTPPHPRRFASFAAAATVVATTLLFGCQSTPLPPADTASLTVTVSTTGEDLDADGFTVTIGTTERALPASGSTTVEGLVAGSYDVSLAGIAANCSVTGEATRTVSVGEGQQAETAFEVECVFDAGGVALAEMACPALAPAATEGLPLDVIAIGSVPSGFEEPIMARVAWSGGPEVTLGLVLEDDATSALELMIPMHPTGSLDGGAVTVRISDTTSACAPFAFDILPLPTASGEVTALADVAQEMLDAQAILFGTTRAELLSTPASDLEPALRPLAIAQSLIDEDSNTASLRAFADATATDFDPEELDFAERLLARTGLLAELEAERDEIQAAAAAVHRRGTASFSEPPATPGASLAPSPGLALDCVVTEELDAALLDECMTLARDKRQGSASQATQENAIFAMDVAATLGSRRIAGPIASLISFSQLYDAALAGNLPSEFTMIEVLPSPAFFQEDQPGPGTWAPAHVWATSLGWNVEEIFTDIVVGEVTPDIRPTRRLSRFQRYVARRGARREFRTAQQIETFFQGLLEGLIEALVERGVALTDSTLAVPPLTYGPVDIADTEFSDARIVTGTSIELTPHETFEPREPGESLLEVITAVGKFGGTSIATEHIPIEVRQLGITIAPAEVVLGPGEEATFTVTVTDAQHPEDVALVAGQPVQGTAQLSIGSAEVHTVTYTAPLEPTPNSTDIVAVEHTGEGGARGLSEEVRSASATIRFGGVTIAPVLVCVSGGQEVQLSAEVVGFDPEPAVLWSASAGTISSAGVLTAPNDVEEVTVTATLEGFPDATDSITIPLGGCVCSFTFQVAGNAPYVGQPGDEVSYSSADGVVPGSPNAVWAVQFTSAADGRGATLGIPTPDVAADAPGTYPLDVAAGSLGYPGGSFYETNPPEGSITFFEYEPHTLLTGEAQATVRDLEDSDLTFQVFAEFQIHRTPAPTGWVRACTIPEEDPS